MTQYQLIKPNILLYSATNGSATVSLETYHLHSIQVSIRDFLLTLATHITGKVPYELLEGVDKEVRRVFPEASEY